MVHSGKGFDLVRHRFRFENEVSQMPLKFCSYTIAKAPRSIFNQDLLDKLCFYSIVAVDLIGPLGLNMNKFNFLFLWLRLIGINLNRHVGLLNLFSFGDIIAGFHFCHHFNKKFYSLG